MSWPIRPDAIYNENKIRQRRAQMYKCDLPWKWYWIVVTDQIGCWLWWKPNRTTMWLIIEMWSMLKTKLICHNRLDRYNLWQKPDMKMMDQSYKSSLLQKWNWDVVIEITGSIYNENKTGQQCDRSYRCGLCWKWYWIVVTDQIRCRLWQKSDRTTMWVIV